MKENHFLIQGKEAASEEEYYFYFWCLALKNEGYIDEIIFQPNSFNLISKKSYRKLELLKTKSKLVEKHLLYQHTYQADYVIVWNKKSHHIFYEVLEDENKLQGLDEVSFFAHNRQGKVISLVDTKGAVNSRFATNNSTVITFPINQKLVYDKYGIYVNKCVPYNSANINNCLFSKTFAPDEYLYRKKAKGSGYLKIYCKPIQIHQFFEKNLKEDISQ
jgi:hypothetical protein